MASRGFCFLVLCLAPITLAACVAPGPAAADATSLVPSIGIDLGSSARVRHVAGLAGEGEGYGRTEPGITPEAHAPMGGTQMDHGSMPGMSHGSMAGMDHALMAGTQMDQGSMPGMGHGSMAGMDHGSMAGMSHGTMAGMPMNRGSMAGTDHGSMAGMSHGSMPGMRRRSTGGTQVAHSGHAHAQGTGTVNSIDAAGHKINVSHAPISAIGLPAMTMDFGVVSSVDLQGIQPGSRINFTIEQDQGGSYVIQSITPAGGGRK